MDIIKKMKRDILELVYNTKEGHIASSFSILDILWVLYDEVMDLENDRFILSKAHGCLALYAVLHEKGFITDEQFKSFCKYDSVLGGHPKLNKSLGIYASCGSLGHGMPISVGMALANKIQGNNSNTYCIVGDGEANEGSIWESALLAQQYKLDNLCCIVDYNHSNDRAIYLGSIANKFAHFGWDVDWIVGHNYYDLRISLNKKSTKPRLIVAETIKGNGCKMMENNPAWHHKMPNEEEYKMLLEELL